jgi:hypothetical protein
MPAAPLLPPDCAYAAPATPKTHADTNTDTANLPVTIFIAHSVTSSNCSRPRASRLKGDRSMCMTTQFPLCSASTHRQSAINNRVAMRDNRRLS